MANMMPQFPFPGSMPPMPASLPGDVEKMMGESVEKSLIKILEKPSKEVQEAFWGQIKDTVFDEKFIKKLKHKFGGEDDEGGEHFCPLKCFFEKLRCIYDSEKSPFELEDEIMQEHNDLSIDEKRVLSSFVRCHFPKMLSMETEKFFETVEDLGTKFHHKKHESEKK